MQKERKAVMGLTSCRLIPELCESFQEEMDDILIEGNSIVEILSTGGKLWKASWLCYY